MLLNEFTCFQKLKLMHLKFNSYNRLYNKQQITMYAYTSISETPALNDEFSFIHHFRFWCVRVMGLCAPVIPEALLSSAICYW